jgi:hypothetical protein
LTALFRGVYIYYCEQAGGITACRYAVEKDGYEPEERFTEAVAMLALERNTGKPGERESKASFRPG